MRLVCPSCEAKYEVPEDAIPDSGRDVQCANCNHSWFQMRARPASAAQPAAEVKKSEVVVPAAEPVPVPVPVPVPEPAPASEPDPVSVSSEPEPEPEPEPEAEADTGSVIETESVAAVAVAEDAASVVDPASESAVAVAADAEIEPEEDTEVEAPIPEQAPSAKPASAAYAVDESVLAILREEAEREALARRAEASPIETQPGLGIDTVMAATPRPVPAPVTPDLDAKPAARRDLLPDVEEINSTLRPAEIPVEPEEAAALAAAQAAEARGGFRSGFLLVMAAAILGAAVYIGAPRISAAVPSLAQPLTAFVGGVDALRLRMDGLMRSATVAINGE